MTSSRAMSADSAHDRDETIRRLSEGRRFLITGHRNPDGDSLGSALGLALALTAAGKDVRIIMRDEWSSAYNFLPGLERVEISETLPPDWPQGYDAIVTMECPDSSRPGYPNLLDGTVINIDHHPGNPRYGTVNLIDLPAAAVGEIVADLLDQASWPITLDIATNLWVSLVSDTGSFRYGNTTPKALALGARLVALGVEPGTVSEALFESKSMSTMRLENLVLSTLKLHADGRIASVELPRRFLTESGANPGDAENLVNTARSIEGVLVALLLRETPQENELRCSLRSKGTVDIRSVALTFGGGGHRNASGCGLSGTIESALPVLVERILPVLPPKTKSHETSR